MDPITTAILAAIVAGATAGVTDTVKKAVGDAYTGLKSLLVSKFGQESEVVKATDALEKKPDSAARLATLGEEVKSVKADEDADVLAKAENIQQQIKSGSGSWQEEVKTTVIASGNRAVAIGRDASNSTITTGDNNVIRRDEADED